MLPKSTSGAARKRIVILLGTLLALNATIAHILTTQLTARASGAQVKEEQVVVEEAPSLTDDESGDEDQHEEVPSITIYTVKAGDTISGIASKFGIKAGTIYAANDLAKNEVLKVGRELVILPINGIQYTVKNGDTISGIAKKFDVSATDILEFNDIDNASSIKVGVDLIIPDAEPVPVEKVAEAPKTVQSLLVKPEVKKATDPLPVSAFSAEDHSHDDEESSSEEVKDESPSEPETPVQSTGRYGIFIPPAPGSVLTQGYHAVNAVDFGASVGTPIIAAAKGVVIVAKGNGAYNGGFGNFIVIAHDNGIQTLYAHLSKVSVSVGDSIDQGDNIGLMGNTGKSTGSHLHFETHGMKNPFTKDKKYTKY